MRIQAEPAAGSGSVGGWDGWSPDRRLRVTLRLCVADLYLERTHEARTKGRIVQGLMFTDEREFLGWCDADDARFDYPLMCSNVRRAGCELLQRLPCATQPSGSLRLA